jgi:predicted lipid-binding transport protein (Tim44 family)
MIDTQIIILIAAAMVALVFAIRLYSALGRRTGHERDASEAFERLNRPGRAVAKPVARPQAPQPVAAAPAAAAFQQPGVFDIQLADKSFDLANFLAGARHAYEIVVTAYAAGDRAALRPLLNDEVYGVFDGAMRGREARGEKVSFSFAGFREVKIDHATLKDNKGEITVAFTAQFTSATTDAGGRVIDGDPAAIRDVVDHWTFARDVTSSDPNWTLVATAGPDAP